MALGLTNKEIAAALALSEHTVKGYVKEILARPGARHRAEAISRARDNGLLYAAGLAAPAPAELHYRNPSE